jgi:4-hydroxybenzoyl-CoA reductase subunit beta
MLPLPIFDYHRPKTLAEALRLLSELGHEARLIAGGTDLLPNMKQGLVEPKHLIAIGKLAELRELRIERGADPANASERLVIGAGMRLVEIEQSLLVRRAATALAEAAGAVGGPHHRAMGTLGGNVCLDTRCRYFNQTYFWRKSLGFCLKKDGTVCHVVKGGQRCVAAASNDSAPALIALEAEIVALGPQGERRLPAAELYTADGIHNTVLLPGEIVVRAALPIVPGRVSAFEKLRRRGAIDFPLLSVAARVDRDVGTRRIEALDLVVSALGARPRRVRAATALVGEPSAAALIDKLADAAFTECKPLTNLDDDPEWRREMVRVVVKRVLTRTLTA